MNGLLDQVMQIESGGNINAQNPNSSAFGPYQFISGTWRDVIGRMRPDLAGLPDKELQALRADPQLSREAAEFYMSKDISPKLQSAGFETTPANAYLGWFLGPQGAVQALKAPASARVADVFPNIVDANANIKFRGKSFGDFTVGDLRDWSASKMQTPAERSQVQTVFGQPDKTTVAAAPGPIYSQDLKTYAQRFGNAVAPDWVEAAKPITAEEAIKQQAKSKELQDLSRGLQGFLSLMQMGRQQQQQEPELPAPRFQGGQFRPLPKMRGFL
jgi:hypothetical protein